MTQEDITLPQAHKIVDMICHELEVHYQHCTLCIPGKWVCPDADLLHKSHAYWLKREETIKGVETP